MTSKIGEPLDERKLFADSRAIKERYQKAGLSKTEVKYVPNIDPAAGRASVTFEIAESPKTRIKEVEFDGAYTFSQSKLRKTIKTRRRWMFSWLTGSGTLKDDQIEDDKEKLADFYREHGFIDFELKQLHYDYDGPKKVNLRWEINEIGRAHV